MNFEKRDVAAKGMRISVIKDGIEIGRAYLYLMKNDLHSRPFGLMEDVYVAEAYLGMRIGSELIRQVIEAAKALRLEASTVRLRRELSRTLSRTAQVESS